MIYSKKKDFINYIKNILEDRFDIVSFFIQYKMINTIILIKDFSDYY